MNTAANFVEKQTSDRPVVVDTEANPSDGEMMALQWFGKENVAVNKVPIPKITNDRDVIVKVTGTTICGSDLHLYHGEILEMKPGDILGHEWCGIVEEVGPKVKNFKKNDRVVSSFQIGCGDCSYCKKDLTSMCDRTNTSKVQELMYGAASGGIYGYSHFTGGYAGGQAEYVRAPIADVNLLKIPNSVPDEKALYLSDIIPTSYHSVVCANIKEGDTVAIWGLGPIGLCAAKWAQLKGAKTIIGIDNVKDRLMKAESFGCKTINFDLVKDVVKGIFEIVPAGVDASIDAAGFRYSKGILHSVQRTLALETDTSETVNEAIKATKKFGTIALIADYVGYTNQFLIGGLMEKGITLRGCGQAPVQKYWHELMKKVESGEFDPSFILTHRFSIEEFKLLYKVFDEKKCGIEKVFVQTRFSSAPAKGTPQLSSVNELLKK
ncbi:GroES-like protein [Nadsonia fulvescens var. elongata DSM 6958]|uniref:GroES-like protein n=1 Tax=Nadsonia fulvescens var. elongata DSM 6958 TaxID=857566 RepID=A0A1E3PFP5_9ASCO|nr:GroES-like protein [Nadsonia fulvescens var. elongata DSM 6958]